MPVLISAIEALLNGADIPHVVLDQNMSVLEGSLGILPRRMLVADERIEQRAAAAARCRARPRASPADAWRSADAATTEDAVLGGRLRLLQPRRGHRVGHDAILLAAAARRARASTRVDLGAGVGAAGLALARARAGTRRVTLVEIDAELARARGREVARNGLTSASARWRSTSRRRRAPSPRRGWRRDAPIAC